MKKLYLLCLILGTFLFFSCSDEEDFYEPTSPKVQKENLFKGKELTSGDAAKIFRSIVESFPYNADGETRSVGIKAITYPDYYGGAYVDDKNRLVVLINESYRTQLPNMIKSLEGDSNVRIIYCDYSFTTLRDIVEEISAFNRNNKDSEVAKNISVYGIDPSNNRVFVRVKNNSNDEIEKFKKNIVDSPAIVFSKIEDGFHDVSLTVYPGSQYYVGTTTTWGSFGYRATWFGYQGFVTAGHVISVGERATTNNGTTELGYCALSEVGGNVDAAFIQCPVLEVNPSNQIYLSSDVLSDEVYNPIFGETVNLMGAATYGNTGYISGIFISVRDENTGIVVDDCIEVNCSSDHGDSGGIVYVKDGGICKTVGIIKGIAGDKTYCVLAENINFQLALSMY